MATVYLCSPRNSTMFTTCCDVAILDHQDKCPQCRQNVVPSGSARWQSAYSPIREGRRWYGNHWPNHGEGRPKRALADGGAPK